MSNTIMLHNATTVTLQRKEFEANSTECGMAFSVLSLHVAFDNAPDMDIEVFTSGPLEGRCFIGANQQITVA